MGKLIQLRPSPSRDVQQETALAAYKKAQAQNEATKSLRESLRHLHGLGERLKKMLKELEELKKS